MCGELEELLTFSDIVTYTYSGKDVDMILTFKCGPVDFLRYEQINSEISVLNVDYFNI